MGQVYSNTVINIGAAQASIPVQGLLPTRSAEHLKTINVRWRPTATDKKMSYSLKHGDSRSLWRTAGRAWAVPESVLSPRVLSVNGLEVFGQCSEVAACEDFPVVKVEEVS